MTSNTEETGAAAQPKTPKKARVSARGADSARARVKVAAKAKAVKKAPKTPKTADGARDGSKAAKVIGLLKRHNGATLTEIMKATDWQAHSVRGFISGSLGKKMGLKVTSEQRENGERAYSINGCHSSVFVPAQLRLRRAFAVDTRIPGKYHQRNLRLLPTSK